MALHIPTGGANCKELHFGTKTKFFWESEDFARNRETWEFSGRHEAIKCKFQECIPKIWDDIQDFREDFDVHIVLFKQHLLEFSPPVIPHAQKVSCFCLQLHVQYIKIKKKTVKM